MIYRKLSKLFLRVIPLLGIGYIVYRAIKDPTFDIIDFNLYFLPYCVLPIMIEIELDLISEKEKTNQNSIKN